MQNNRLIGSIIKSVALQQLDAKPQIHDHTQPVQIFSHHSSHNSLLTVVKKKKACGLAAFFEIYRSMNFSVCWEY